MQPHGHLLHAGHPKAGSKILHGDGGLLRPPVGQVQRQATPSIYRAHIAFPRSRQPGLRLSRQLRLQAAVPDRRGAPPGAHQAKLEIPPQLRDQMAPARRHREHRLRRRGGHEPPQGKARHHPQEAGRCHRQAPVPRARDAGINRRHSVLRRRRPSGRA